MSAANALSHIAPELRPAWVGARTPVMMRIPADSARRFARSLPRAAALVACMACTAPALAGPEEVDAARQRVAALEAELAAARAALAEAEADAAPSQTPSEDVVESAPATTVDTAGTDTTPGTSAIQPRQGFFEGWTGTAQAGVSGSSGNSESLNARLSFDASRLTERTETFFDTSFTYETSDGEETTNRFEAGLRNDWLVPGSKWRYFAQARYENDQFQDWDHRISGFAGIGYEFIDNDKTSLIGRLGVGGSQTIGGEEENFRPEALLGLDLTHDLSDTTKFKAGTEVFPSLEDAGDFRANSYAGLSVMLDEDSNLSLNLGVEHRYDTDPGGEANRSDLDYFVTLGWSF